MAYQTTKEGFYITLDEICASLIGREDTKRSLRYHLRHLNANQPNPKNKDEYFIEHGVWDDMDICFYIGFLGQSSEPPNRVREEGLRRTTVEDVVSLLEVEYIVAKGHLLRKAKEGKAKTIGGDVWEIADGAWIEMKEKLGNGNSLRWNWWHEDTKGYGWAKEKDHKADAANCRALSF